jgi:hypothetical protein
MRNLLVAASRRRFMRNILRAFDLSGASRLETCCSFDRIVGWINLALTSIRGIRSVEPLLGCLKTLQARNLRAQIDVLPFRIEAGVFN